MENPVELEKLLESLETIEAQRGILGDATVDPLIADIRSRALDSVEQPSETDLNIYDSWQSVIEATQAAGIEAPSPSPEVAAATTAVERYNSILARLGSSGLQAAAATEPTATHGAPEQQTGAAVPVEVVTVEPDTQPALPTDISDATANTPSVEPVELTDLTSSADQTPIAANESTNDEALSQPTTIEINPDQTLIITDGTTIIEPTEAKRAVYAKILSALANAPDGVLTSKLCRDISGVTTRELQLYKKGKLPLDPSIDSVAATTIQRHIYAVIKTLRESGFIEHRRGSVVKKGAGSTNQPGHISLIAPPNITEQDGSTRVNVTPRPYQVTIDTYRQSIDNGRGTEVELTINPEHFKRVARALGRIAVKAEDEDQKISRNDITNWLEDSDPGLTKSDGSKVTSYLRTIISNFDGKFPLSAHGATGGAHFKFIAGSAFEVHEGWPEKPRFDDPVIISISDNRVTATIDGEVHELLDYSKVVAGEIFDSLSLTARAECLFSVFSLMSQSDTMTLEDIGEMISSDGSVNVEEHTAAAWVRSVVEKLNSAAGEPIINWRRFDNVYIDLNRSIVIDQDDSNRPDDTTGPDTSPEQILSPQPEETPVDKAPTDPGDMPVGDRPTPEHIGLKLKQLDEKTKRTIHGRLIEHNRFSYPAKLEEAAFLLHLITDGAVLAEVRNGSRFARDDESVFQNFVAEVLYACYLRSLSWGSFDELLEAASAMEPVGERSNVQLLARDFKDTVQTIISTSAEPNAHTHDSDRQANQRFGQSVLVMLTGGQIPEPANAVQAITLLDAFRKNREQIAANKSRAEFNAITNRLHEKVEEVLGRANAFAAQSTRIPRYRSNTGKAVQTSGGRGTPALARTDAMRYPDKKVSKSSRRRRRKS